MIKNSHFSNFRIFLIILMLGILGCKQNTSDSQENRLTNTNFNKVSVEQLDDFLTENRDVIILDLRTDHEIKEGMLPKAIQLDFRATDFDTKLESLDKEKHYLVYCAKGGRSQQCQDIMQAKGFEQVTDLTDGYDSYKKSLN